MSQNAPMIDEIRRAAINVACERQGLLITRLEQLRTHNQRMLRWAVNNSDQQARWKPVLLPHPNWLVKWHPPEPLPEAAFVQEPEVVPLPKTGERKITRLSAPKVNMDVPELEEDTPLWQRVMVMWKKFYTPTEIAKALDITIDDVQNAKRFARQMAAEREAVLV